MILFYEEKAHSKQYLLLSVPGSLVRVGTGQCSGLLAPAPHVPHCQRRGHVWPTAPAGPTAGTSQTGPHADPWVMECVAPGSRDGVRGVCGVMADQCQHATAPTFWPVMTPWSPAQWSVQWTAVCPSGQAGAVSSVGVARLGGVTT